MSAAALPASVDVLVVGGRCAGAATALLLARRGARVLVVERSPAGADTLSTHALMRGAVVQLHRWGLLPAIAAAGTPAIARTTFDYHGDTVTVDISDKHGVASLVAPRRTVLDRILADAARDAGAEVRYGQRLLGLHRDDRGRVSGATIGDLAGQTHSVQAGLVVGADGRHSLVARLTGAARLHGGKAATGTVYGHWPGLGDHDYRWLYGPDASAGVIATNGGACVFATVAAADFAATFRPDVAAGFRQVLRRLDPALAEAVKRDGPIAGWHGFGGQPGSFMQSHGPGWALVGDAAYFKDPLTAHGITDALLHAELLADAITGGGDAALAGYQARRTAVALPVFEATEAIASFDWTLEELRGLHTRLSRAMAREIDTALAFFGQPFAEIAGPAPDLDDLGRRAVDDRPGQNQQELARIQ
jgi:menaquinone-9 beta-reductase